MSSHSSKHHKAHQKSLKERLHSKLQHIVNSDIDWNDPDMVEEIERLLKFAVKNRIAIDGIKNSHTEEDILHQAIRGGNLKIIHQILDGNAISGNAQSYMQYAKSHLGEDLQHEIISKILSKTKEKLNKLLIKAAKQNNVSEVERLILSGANPNARDGETGMTALHYAARNGNIDMAIKLIELSRKQGIRLNLTATDKNGQTPLNYAAINNHGDIFSAILKELKRQIREDQQYAKNHDSSPQRDRNNNKSKGDQDSQARQDDTGQKNLLRQQKEEEQQRLQEMERAKLLQIAQETQKHLDRQQKLKDRQLEQQRQADAITRTEQQQKIAEQTKKEQEAQEIERRAKEIEEQELARKKEEKPQPKKQPQSASADSSKADRVSKADDSSGSKTKRQHNKQKEEEKRIAKIKLDIKNGKITQETIKEMSRDELNSTLIAAAMIGRRDLTVILINHGADINATFQGKPVAVVSAEFGNHQISELISLKGAKLYGYRDKLENLQTGSDSIPAKTSFTEKMIEQKEDNANTKQR